MYSDPDSQKNGDRNGNEQAGERAGVWTAADILKLGLRGDELGATVPEAVPWPWHGYMGSGKITLLTSLPRLSLTHRHGTLLASHRGVTFASDNGDATMHVKRE